LANKISPECEWKGGVCVDGEGGGKEGEGGRRKRKSEREREREREREKYSESLLAQRPCAVCVLVAVS